jgi:hypothetical protein
VAPSVVDNDNAQQPLLGNSAKICRFLSAFPELTLDHPTPFVI